MNFGILFLDCYFLPMNNVIEYFLITIIILGSLNMVWETCNQKIIVNHNGRLLI